MAFSKPWTPPIASEILRRLNDDRAEFQASRMMKTEKRPLLRVSSKFFHSFRGECASFIPSNLPRLRYLDLVETRLTVLINSTATTQLTREDILANHPLLDYPIVGNSLRARIQQTVEENMYKTSQYHVNFEAVCIGIEHLISQWNVEALVNMTNFTIGVLADYGILFEMGEYFVDIMMLHDYKNSDLVLRIFKAICLELMSKNRNFVGKLPVDKLLFFVWHLRRTVNYKTYVMEHWYEAQDPLFCSIVHGKPDATKKFIFYKYPSVVYPLAMRTKNLWPRSKSSEVPVRSFYSLEYYCYFVDRLFHMIFLYKLWSRKTDFKGAFQVLWRSIPTPYLPLPDIQLYTRRNNKAFDDWTWAMVTDLFSEDYPYEYKPRSLLHLSRCAVRKACPDADELPVSEPVRDYLMLGETMKASPSASEVKILYEDIENDSLRLR